MRSRWLRLAFSHTVLASLQHFQLDVVLWTGSGVAGLFSGCDIDLARTETAARLLVGSIVVAVVLGRGDRRLVEQIPVMLMTLNGRPAEQWRNGLPLAGINLSYSSLAYGRIEPLVPARLTLLGLLAVEPPGALDKDRSVGLHESDATKNCRTSVGRKGRSLGRCQVVCRWPDMLWRKNRNEVVRIMANVNAYANSKASNRLSGPWSAGLRPFR
jgi:hypothetical protein